MSDTSVNLATLQSIARRIVTATDEALQNRGHDPQLFNAASEHIIAGGNFDAHSGTLNALLNEELETLLEANREFAMAEDEKLADIF